MNAEPESSVLSRMNKITAFISVLSLGAALPLFAQEAKPDAQQLKGEILDMACYLDHAAAGEKHAKCANTCISSGLPVGLKAEDGKVYFVIGDHKPMNKELAAFAGKVVTLRGKVASRDGINLLENAELVK